jgi:hypothetical protein
MLIKCRLIKKELLDNTIKNNDCINPCSECNICFVARNYYNLNGFRNVEEMVIWVKKNYTKLIGSQQLELDLYE